MTLQDLKDEASARLARLEESRPYRSHEAVSQIQWGGRIGTYVTASRGARGLQFKTHTITG